MRTTFRLQFKELVQTISLGQYVQAIIQWRQNLSCIIFCIIFQYEKIFQMIKFYNIIKDYIFCAFFCIWNRTDPINRL